MVRKLADGTKKKVAGTNSVRRIHREEIPKRGVPFEFAKVSRLKHMGKKLDYFGFPSIGAQEELLKNHRSPAASVGDEGQVPLAAFVVADDVADNGEWGLEGAIGLENIEQVGAKRHLREFQ